MPMEYPSFMNGYSKMAEAKKIMLRNIKLEIWSIG